MQDGTGNTQETRCDSGRPTGNIQQATRNGAHVPDEMRRGTGDRQRTPHGMGHFGGHPKTGNGERVTCGGERARRQDPTDSNAADDHWKMCNRQQTTCNMHQGKCNRRHAATHNIQTCARLRATCSEQPRHVTQHETGNVHATNHRQRCKDCVQRTTGNKATDNRRPAACGKRRAKDGKQQATHATDNVQQTADGMQEDASTCEMQLETHGAAAFRVRRGAGSGQRSTSSMRVELYSTTTAQHGTDATHKMHLTTRAEACIKHTWNRQHAAGNAIHGMVMRRKVSGRSRTSGLRRARCCGGHGDSEVHRVLIEYCGPECDPVRVTVSSFATRLRRRSRPLRVHQPVRLLGAPGGIAQRTCSSSCWHPCRAWPSS
jgi:hypothetical protein